MSKKILIVPILMMLVSCSIVSQELSGTQQIRVRIWRNHTPDLLQNEADSDKFNVDELLLDVGAENVIEFDTQVVGNTVYVAYTADKIVHVAMYPTNTFRDSLDLDLAKDLIDGMTREDKIFKYQIVQTLREKQYIIQREIVTGITTNITPPAIIKQETISQNGVWLKVLKGTLKGSERNPSLRWESIIDQDIPMIISDITFVSLERQVATLVAISTNTKVVVLNDVDQNGVLNFISRDLLGRNYNNISQLNSWRDGNKTYISVVADSTLITGFYKDLLWTETYRAEFKYSIKNMQVNAGMDFAYGIWINEATGMMNVAIYNNSFSIARRWLVVDRLSSAKHPQLNVVTFTDLNNVMRERAFLGAVDERKNYFQLFIIKKLGTAFLGPIISDWNERYAFAPNTLGQVLYIRANFDHKLIFSGLSSLETWTPVQISTPPPVTVHPQSTIDSYFLNTFYNLTIFKQANGSIYFLAGIR